MALNGRSQTSPAAVFGTFAAAEIASERFLMIGESFPILFVCALFITYGWNTAQFVRNMR